VWALRTLGLGDLVPGGAQLPTIGSTHGLVMAGRPANFDNYPHQYQPFVVLVSGDGVHVDAVPNVARAAR
jgi:hypothetical protein